MSGYGFGECKLCGAVDDLAPRFRKHIAINESTGCWDYQGYRLKGGYGRYGQKLAHRYTYEVLVGTIPEGMDLDHLCRNPSCVHPCHLEPVTHAENMRRGVWDPLKSFQKKKTHCPHGHEYTSENTQITKAGHRKSTQHATPEESAPACNAKRNGDA